MDLNEIKWVLKFIEQEEYEKLVDELNKKKEKILFNKEKKKNRKIPKKATLQIQVDVSQKTKDIADEYRGNLIQNQTTAEKKAKIILKLAGIKFTYQKIFYYKNKEGFERFYIADFYLPEYNIILEIDGGYHSEKQQKIEDKKRTSVLRQIHKVSKVVRIVNEDTDNTEYCIEKIKRLLK